jgi:hypothetical protein
MRNGSVSLSAQDEAESSLIGFALLPCKGLRNIIPQKKKSCSKHRAPYYTGLIIADYAFLYNLDFLIRAAFQFGVTTSAHEPPQIAFSFIHWPAFFPSSVPVPFPF